MDKFGERLEFFLAKEDIGITSAAKKIGIPQTTLSSYKNGTKFPHDFIEKVEKAFPELNTTWLVTGKGEMLVKQRGNTLHEDQEKYSKTDNSNKKPPLDLEADKIPVISMNRLARLKKKEDIIKLYKSDELPEGFAIVPEMGFCNAYIKMLGDTMHPTIKPGEEMFCELQTDLRFIEFGVAYIINVAGRIIARRIYGTLDPTIVKLVADNDEYPEMDIEKSLIEYLYVIHKFVRGDTGRQIAA